MIGGNGKEKKGGSKRKVGDRYVLDWDDSKFIILNRFFLSLQYYVAKLICYGVSNIIMLVRGKYANLKLFLSGNSNNIYMKYDIFAIKCNLDVTNLFIINVKFF